MRSCSLLIVKVNKKNTQHTYFEKLMHTTKAVWKSRLGALGPGILMATAAIGGSHLVASTQAGALFGWQLFWLILVVNVLSNRVSNVDMVTRKINFHRVSFYLLPHK